MPCLLSIETSCDETSAAILSWNDDGFVFLSHLVESQIAIHQPFGGVVPEVAARDHLAKIDDVVRKCMEQAGVRPHELDAVAVTMGPGLIGALMVGVLYARGLAIGLNKPLYAVNHVDAHLAPALCLPSWKIGQIYPYPDWQFPALALTVSGGHCHLSFLRTAQDRTLLGRTADDACGEAFDKVAKLLGLAYPGGPAIESLAATVSESKWHFSESLQDKKNRYGFSYSGLKTGVLHAIQKQVVGQMTRVSGQNLPNQTKAQLAFAFQKAAIGQLKDRVSNALEDHKTQVKCIYVAGGVAANSVFRQVFAEFSVPVLFAPVPLCSDNAAMIALQAMLQIRNGSACHGFEIQPFSRYAEVSRV